MKRGNQLQVAVLGVLTVFGTCGLADEVPKDKPVSLLGMLDEWLYPGAKFQGAETSDAAVSDISSIKSQALFTTTDSAEKVLSHYRAKLNVDAKGANVGKENDGENLKGKRSVLVQNNSAGRSLKLYIVAVNDVGSSTTLVISRAATEETTYIAWSNFRNLSP